MIRRSQQGSDSHMIQKKLQVTVGEELRDRLKELSLVLHPLPI
jgi:hypothetical protein